MAGTHYKDTDYLHATARVRALESAIVTGRDFRKMIEAKNVQEAYKVLSDAPICQGTPLESYEEALNRNLLEAYRLVEGIAPDKAVVEIFRYKYDGHNLKTLVKAKKASINTAGILSGLGNVPAETAAAELEAGRFEKVDPVLGAAALEAVEALARTGDPQLVDLHIDKAVLEAQARKAESFGNAFLCRFVAAQVDVANIRTAVRMLRMGKDVFALRRVLAGGGRLDPGTLAEAYARGMDDLLACVGASDCGKQLEPSFDSLRSGGSLTLFEKLCDNYLTSLLDSVKTVPFGVEPLVAYLCAKEGETRAARIVLASKLAGVPAQQITERLRDTYA